MVATVMDGAVSFTQEAVLAYLERVRPCSTPERARRELERIAHLARLADEAPEWVWPGPERDAYAVLGDVALPLIADGDGWVAVTVLARGTLPEGMRAHRNRLAAARRARRHRKPRPGRRPAPPPEPLTAALEAA